MAYYGNLALRPEPEQEQKVQRARATQTTTVTLRRSIPIGEKLLYLLTIAIVVFIAGFIILRYAQIYQMNGQIQSLKKSYNQTIEQNKDLQRQKEISSDSTEIIKRATAMGMVQNPESITASKDDQNAVAMKP